MKPKKEVNRRFFFKQAALAGASLVTAPQLLSQPFNSSLSDKFDRKPNELPTRKLGPLGFGAWARLYESSVWHLQSNSLQSRNDFTFAQSSGEGNHLF